MQPTGLVLYVQHVAASCDFYRQLLGADPVEQHPGFAFFVLANGSTLGLWARSDVDPPALVAAGSIELSLALGREADVDAAALQWRALGWPVLQAPVQQDYGYTACTADPDGHRVRAYCLR